MPPPLDVIPPDLSALGQTSLAEDDPRNPWFSWDYVRHNMDALTAALQQHVTLTVAAVAVAAAIGIPLAVLAYHVGWLAGPILATTGVLYTIPSLALFAMLGPILGLTFGTALVGLVLYALLMVVRDTLTGLRQVPAEVRDAAAGMGYGQVGQLLRVELPLALPGIISGLRVATVSTVALVTVCTVVSFGGFGNLILTGFANNFYKPQIMAGTIGCLALALVLDLLLVGIGRAIMPWSRTRRSAARARTRAGARAGASAGTRAGAGSG